MSAWDEVADAWVRHAREGDEPWTWNEPALLELVPPPGALSVDAGCGEGRFTRTLRKRGHSTVAFDSTTALIDAARAADPSGEYLVADVTSLPLGDQAADLVVSVNVLQHVTDLDAAVAEAARVLVPGGCLLVCIVHPLSSAGEFADDDSFVLQDYLGHYERTQPLGGGAVVHRHRPVETYVRSLATAGFAVDALREIPAQRRGGRIPLYLHVRASASSRD